MDSLFSEDPEFRRVQYKKLSDNVREWQQEISAMVAEKLPKDLGVEVTVVFQKVDDEKGYAVGTAIARATEGDKQIGIPIIVKSWHLAPIDLFFSEGKLYPLTDDNLAKIFYQNSLGAGLAPKQPPPMLADDVYADMRMPPLGGKYSYSAPFSVLRLISGTLGADDLRLMKTAIDRQPSLLTGYGRRNTMPVLEKYAQEKPKPDEQDEINKDRTMAVFTIKKDGPDAYRLFSAPDEVYDPVMVTTNRQGIKRFLAMRQAELVDYEKDPMLAVDKNGHYTIAPPETVYGNPVDGPTGENQLGPRKNPWVFNPLQDDRTAVNVDSFGRYGVLDRDGVLAKGWVIPNVVHFDGSKAPNKVFLSNALAAYQTRIAGIPVPDNADTTLKPDKPDTGKIGVLVYREGKEVFCTVPFQIVGVTVYKNLRSLSIVDARGYQCNLIITPNINGIVNIADSDGKRSELGPLLGKKMNYFVSAKMFFVRMPRLCPVTEAPEDFKRKAAEWLDHNPIKVAMANGRYVLRGRRLDKLADVPAIAPAQSVQQRQHAASQGIAKAVKTAPSIINTGPGRELGPGWQTPAIKPKVEQSTTRVSPATQIKKASFDLNSLERYEAEFLLASWGLPLEKCAEVLDGVQSRVVLEVHHLNLPNPPGTVKVASPARQAIVRQMRAPIGELLKIAASIDDVQTVDSVLSLGFVNEENVARFASIKPMLWEVSHMLAKLLLASRLGVEDIPEEAVRSALAHLQRVIDGLGRLKMLEEHQQTKTSSAQPNNLRHVGGRLVRGAEPVGITR